MRKIDKITEKIKGWGRGSKDNRQVWEEIEKELDVGLKDNGRDYWFWL